MKWGKKLFFVGSDMLLLLMDNIQRIHPLLCFPHSESTNHDALVLNMFYYFILMFVEILSNLAATAPEMVPVEWRG